MSMRNPEVHLDFIPTPLNLGLMQILTLHGSTVEVLNIITFSRFLNRA